ncbi:hypothetical protein DCS_02714 [Drechmeria coniospora]|uniref:Integral membrane protein n=1 Tax=Drechmeria coniospora TaxID=98403 RepID=A0A151GX12_DRECN|nr:hypothetical protein DCS_02714 [Drechmeria coniospora]KYK61572.1 hypothetical protein DCS_02714 [Drechmeria coniospora]ODA79831.1 hypothetical protein RJ55_05427 [Drechmeria coniospora]
MASGLFQTALLLAPLTSSTATLVCAWDQHVFHSALTRPETQPHAEAILPSFWRTLLPTGLPQVVAQLGATACTSTVALCLHGDLLRRRSAHGWYVAAATLAVAHLAYGPLVARSIKRVLDDERREGRSNVAVERVWVDVNLLRMLTTDLAAWACALVAVTKALTAHP